MDSLTERIAITGIGLISPLGDSAESTWKRVKNTECGIREMTAMESVSPASKDGGQAVDLPADFAPDLPREARYLKLAIRQALQSADAFDSLPCDPSRACYMLGTTLHGMRAAGRYLRSGDLSELRNFNAGDTLRLATADFPLRGGSATTCSACSSSLGSIALGITLLQSGQADLVVAGGYDTISEYAWAGFNSLRLVSDPPLRPFTAGRQGMKLAEAYAIVILERAGSCKDRNKTPFAYIAGWGETADAHHLTQPHPQGAGALSAMQQAMRRAGISTKSIGLIAAHATGTPDNDSSERAAIVQLLSSEKADAPVVGFKSHLGHTLGGAGACELILSIQAMKDQVIPACANVDPTQLEYSDLVVTHTQVRPGEVEYTLNTSLGFGGANTCVVLSRKNARLSSPIQTKEQVVITGIGAILPGVSSIDALRDRLKSDIAPEGVRLKTIEDAELEGLLNARRVRRMSNYVKLSLSACSIAVSDARWEMPCDSAAILGTTHGSAGYSYEYYSQIVREGVTAANPMLFAEGVPNAAAAQLSLMLGLKQACQTIIGTRTAGIDALRFAMLRIETRQWKRAIVSAGEELSQIVVDAYRNCGLHALTGSASGFECGTGSVALTIESAESARERGAKIYGTLTHSSAASGPVDEIARTISRTLQPGLPIFGSNNHTYIDRAEEIGARISGSILVSSGLSTQFGELFSATPLLTLVAQLLNPIHPEFGILCTDFSGNAASVNVQVQR